MLTCLLAAVAQWILLESLCNVPQLQMQQVTLNEGAEWL